MNYRYSCYAIQKQTPPLYPLPEGEGTLMR